MAEGEEVVETKKKSRWLLWTIIGSVVLVAGVVGSFLALEYLRPPEVVASTDGSGEAGDATGLQGGAATHVQSTMNLDPFLVNLADEDSTRFVKLTIRLGLDQAGLGERYGENPVITAATRDKIISILTTKTAEQILTPQGKDTLRSEIRDIVTPLLPKGKVVEVYIMDFVVQL
ncbi:MAG: hypothetical protein FJW35_13925 [Acidobacteria bacterium]|nr:hypothetical protein [Acidobacteriota bacterium]